MSRAPAQLRASAVSVGAAHACAVGRDDGRVVCWGRDDAGQVRKTPTGEAFAGVSAGDNLTCGVTTEGILRCWGAWRWNPQ